MLNVSERGLVAMSVAVVQAPPETMNQMCKDWLLNYNPPLLKEIMEEQVKRLTEQKKHLTLVTDPATVRKISRSKGRA